MAAPCPWWHTGHPRIVNSIVAGDAAVYCAECRKASLLHLDAEFAQQFAATVVGGFLPEDVLVLALHDLPLGQVVLAYRGTH
jgi:hypothetical protein